MQYGLFLQYHGLFIYNLILELLEIYLLIDLHLFLVLYIRYKLIGLQLNMIFPR